MAERRCSAHADVEQSDGGTKTTWPAIQLYYIKERNTKKVD